MSDKALLYSEEIPGGAHWSMIMRRGTGLRLIDKEGGANVGMLLYNPDNLLERYNAPDTLKCQHTFKLTSPHCLYSDMGRIFCSITGDSVGWHDTVCGTTSDAIIKAKWGERGYQEYRNDWYLSGRNSFLIEIAKYGLGKRDLAANLNFFSKAVVDDNGKLLYVADHSRAGDYVELRFEMDTLVVFNTCPHPLDPAADYPKRPIHYEVYRTPAVTDDDPCKQLREENVRGFSNTQRYVCAGDSSND